FLNRRRRLLRDWGARFELQIARLREGFMHGAARLNVELRRREKIGVGGRLGPGPIGARQQGDQAEGRGGAGPEFQYRGSKGGLAVGSELPGLSQTPRPGRRFVSEARVGYSNNPGEETSPTLRLARGGHDAC